MKPGLDFEPGLLGFCLVRGNNGKLRIASSRASCSGDPPVTHTEAQRIFSALSWL